MTEEENWRSVSLKSRDVGEVDIVVNNAGYFPNRSIDELDLSTWRKTIARNQKRGPQRTFCIFDPFPVEDRNLRKQNVLGNQR